jgi:outer membrane protein
MFKHNCSRIVAFLCVLAVGVLSSETSPAQTAQSPQPVIGVVDYDLILNESKAGKGARAQLDKQAAAFKTEYKKQRKAFDDAGAKLKAQQGSLSDEELKKKVEELNAQGAKIEKALTQQEKALDANYKKARDQITAALDTIVTSIAKKRGMTLVLKKSAAVAFAVEYEFTDEAMKQLDAKLPAVKLQASN